MLGFALSVPHAFATSDITDHDLPWPKLAALRQNAGAAPAHSVEDTVGAMLAIRDFLSASYAYARASCSCGNAPPRVPIVSARDDLELRAAVR